MGFENIAPTLSLIDTVALTPAAGQFWAIWTPVLRPYCAQLFAAILESNLFYGVVC
jgi:hypothetical protein